MSSMTEAELVQQIALDEDSRHQFKRRRKRREKGMELFVESEQGSYPCFLTSDMLCHAAHAE